MDDFKKYILLQNNYSVAYAEDKCFVNNEECKKENDDTRSPIDIAKGLKNKLYDSFLKKHYKHIVVLTAAGTSLDNGDKSGKTRGGLWIECNLK